MCTASAFPFQLDLGKTGACQISCGPTHPVKARWLMSTRSTLVHRATPRRFASTRRGSTLRSCVRHSGVSQLQKYGVTVMPHRWIKTYQQWRMFVPVALPGVNLLVGTESGLMLLDRSGQGKVYPLINRRRIQQMDVLEGLNVLVTISGRAHVPTRKSRFRFIFNQ